MLSTPQWRVKLFVALVHTKLNHFESKRALADGRIQINLLLIEVICRRRCMLVAVRKPSDSHELLGMSQQRFSPNEMSRGVWRKTEREKKSFSWNRSDKIINKNASTLTNKLYFMIHLKSHRR